MNNLGAKLRELRVERGLSIREFARRAEISPSFVSQIENDRAKPSVATLYAFSQILGVTVDDLFLSDAPASDNPFAGWTDGAEHNPANIWRPSAYANRFSVIHPSHRSVLQMADGVTWQRMAATPEHGVAFVKIVYSPGATSTAGGALVSHEGYEYGYVLKGELEVTVDEETVTLHAGESLGLDSTIPHVLRNPGSDEFEGIWFVHSRRH